MRIIDYKTKGGKNVIKEYLDKLPEKDKIAGYDIRRAIRKQGDTALKALNTRQLKGKLWEIKFSSNRIMYITADQHKIYFLHICKKQKQKAEKGNLNKAIKRAKEIGLTID
ncbi:MAG: type II toxin-antitoxin system RelE/ParE family toxin [Turicibacter sp.]|nr:type II toxin-antitoxin system RelE/ParE family toxin [Turicibacter sp.]